MFKPIRGNCITMSIIIVLLDIMYCKHTLLGTNISPPKAIWRWLSFYQGGICLFPGGYCILVIIIFQDFRPILPFTQEIADTFSPEKLTMELLTGTSFSSCFCTQTKTIKVYNEIVHDHPQWYHTISSVVSSNWTSSNWTSSNFNHHLPLCTVNS